MSCEQAPPDKVAAVSGVLVKVVVDGKAADALARPCQVQTSVKSTHDCICHQLAGQGSAGQC